LAIGDVNRAKLYYLRERVGKKARVREKRYGHGAALPETVDSGLLAEDEPVLEEVAAVEETSAVEESTVPEVEAEAAEAPETEATADEPVAAEAGEADAVPAEQQSS
jgi:large subunit ribosomal protein L19